MLSDNKKGRRSDLFHFQYLGYGFFTDFCGAEGDSLLSFVAGGLVTAGGLGTGGLTGATSGV